MNEYYFLNYDTYINSVQYFSIKQVNLSAVYKKHHGIRYDI